MARAASIDAIQIGQPDLLQSNDARRGRELVRVLDRRLQPAEPGLRRAPFGNVLMKEHPREDDQKGEAERGECDVERRRRGVLHLHGHTHAQFGPRKNVPVTVRLTMTTTMIVNTMLLTRRSGANHCPAPVVPRSTYGSARSAATSSVGTITPPMSAE